MFLCTLDKMKSDVRVVPQKLLVVLVVVRNSLFVVVVGEMVKMNMKMMKIGSSDLLLD